MRSCYKTDNNEGDGMMGNQRQEKWLGREVFPMKTTVESGRSGRQRRK